MNALRSHGRLKVGAGAGTITRCGRIRNLPSKHQLNPRVVFPDSTRWMGERNNRMMTSSSSSLSPSWLSSSSSCPWNNRLFSSSRSLHRHHFELHRKNNPPNGLSYRHGHSNNIFHRQQRGLFHVISNCWHSRQEFQLRCWSGGGTSSYNLVMPTIRHHPTLNNLSPLRRQSLQPPFITMAPPRYISNTTSSMSLSKSSSKNDLTKDQTSNKNDNKSNNDKDSTFSGMQPKFQDTELPLYSFFDSFLDDNDTKNDSNNNFNHSHNSNSKIPPPPMSKMLSILYPEAKLLTLALGALTISTAATMQFPNAIGEIIDILGTVHAASGVGSVDAASSIVSNGVESIGDAIAESQQSAAADSSTAVDVSQQQDITQQLQSIGLQMMSYFTIGAVATFAHSALFDSIGQKIGAHLRKELFSKLIHQDVAFFDKNRAGELANRLSTDVHEVAEHLVQNIAYFLSNLVRSLTAVYQMMALSPLLTMYLSPLPVLLGGCAAFYGSFIKRWSKQHLDVLAHSTHVATERFGGISTVLSFGQRSAERARYTKVIEAAYGFARRVAVFQGAFLGSSYWVGNGALLGVLIVGSFQVLEGNMTPGNLAGFCMFAGHLADSVVELSEAVGGFLRAQGSGARLFDLLEREGSAGGAAATTTNVVDGTDGVEKSLLVTATTLPPSYSPTVRFENVSFAYPSHPNAAILNDLSFTLRPTEMLAVTGSSGSGKSSILSLLMRFYEPTGKGGRITLDGVDIRELDAEWLRSQIGMVGQEPILFHGSVFENVAYGKPHASHDEVIEACVAANAHRFILELPDQYDTIVGERGASISGGQKQRLCIARALLTKPRILALDEASSALDAQTEQDFLHCLRILLDSPKNDLSAVLFITHKRSVLQACDRVAVLSDGRITESGEFELLDRTKGDQLRKLTLK